MFVNIAVGPLHSAGMLAKQMAILDVLGEGRLTVGLGVGGRATTTAPPVRPSSAATNVSTTSSPN